MREPKRKLLNLGVLMLVFLLAMACIPSSDGDDADQDGQVLFEDDFEDDGSGWEIGEYDFGSVGYGDGVYVVEALSDGDPMWGVAYQDFDDVVIEVDASQVSAGPEDNNAYGVVCRDQGESNNNGYYMHISGDGYYAIHVATDGEFEALVDWTESSSIRQGNATNHIRVICDGSTLTLFVNGRKLAEAEDSTYASGDVALTATSFEDAPTEVHFDDLVVREPAP